MRIKLLVAWTVVLTCVASAQQPTVSLSPLAAEIIALENQIWQHWKDRKFDAIDALLAQDMIAVDAAGSYNRAEFLAAVRESKCTVASFKLLDTKVTRLADDAMLITYRSEATGTCDGKKLDDNADVNSTAWVKRNGKWLTIFHHQSPAEKK